MAADARRTGLPSGSFDLVHARTLLITVPEPAAVVAEMVRLARPGGWVAGLEPNSEHSLCYPAHPAWDRLSEIFHTAFRRNGADPFIGRRVTELYRQAGLQAVGVQARAPAYPAGHTRRMLRPDLVRSMRPMILDMGSPTSVNLMRWTGPFASISMTRTRSSCPDCTFSPGVASRELTSGPASPAA